MKIRSATSSDLQTIAAIHIESWKDAYTDDLPADFFERQINDEFTKHWNEVDIPCPATDGTAGIGILFFA